MVRVAGLKQQLASGVTATAADGLSPTEQLQAITAEVPGDGPAVRYGLAGRAGPAAPLPRRRAARARRARPDPAERRCASTSARRSSRRSRPLAVDPGHPFPHLRNKSLNLAVVLQRDGRKRRAGSAPGDLAVVQVPTVLAGSCRCPPARAGARTSCSRTSSACTWASSSPASPCEQTAAFRVTRNWDLNVDEEESEDLLSTIQEELRRRDRGDGGAARAGRSAPRSPWRPRCASRSG